MQDVFIAEALRTPCGSLGGSLAELSAPQLAAAVIQGLLRNCTLPPEAVNEVILGQVLSGGCGQAPARQAMRAAGIPDTAHALTINKVCSSGIKSIMLAADSIRLGASEVVVAGGMESMSQAPFFLKKARSGYRMGHGELLDLMVYDGLQDPYSGRHMGEIGEESASRHGISREAQDQFALRSYQLAQEASQSGLFDGEIVPVVKSGKKGTETVSRDEEPFKVDLSRLTQLRPAFAKDGTITAGNASSISDGAAACLVAGSEALRRYDLSPKARLVAYSTASLHPDLFPEAPVSAIERVCAAAGLKVGEIDLFEINEAFASVTLLAMRKHDLPLEKVNVNGGACALGHPIGASGARLVTTLVRELRRRKARYGLATLCNGGGEAVAAIIERV
ncbi:thiolase family protein [Geomonas sp. RF6]|uniref:thiolase family protein n=1 Tax=Geomonas sp. RF6 TaxID=2897342 RepID=UPI001E49A4A4|nr:thiolase family protein [Geomonas sp. RF6]UFS70738.1 thiolase family protein [Geomonas sp. RF6]